MKLQDIKVGMTVYVRPWDGEVAGLDFFRGGGMEIAAREGCVVSRVDTSDGTFCASGRWFPVEQAQVDPV